ncbi:MAG TPA: hypothetical protein VGR61_07885, partial [Candidatus Dormibacteraeota bacterium]|nr:hypothetical protein [Candidatus Dormibacteraeota bacterium]
ERYPALSLALLAALLIGVVLRAIGQLAGREWRWLAVAGGIVAAAGMLGVAAAAARTLRANRHPGATWAIFAWFGTGWWVAWAALSVLAGGLLSTTGAVPPAMDRAAVWAVVLGAIGNFIWAVQSRMIPTSFGRPAAARRSLLVAAILYNAGVAITLTSVAAPLIGQVPDGAQWLMRLGLGVAGASTVWLAASCGALGGRAERLRPASRPLARYIVWANRWTVFAGISLVIYSLRTMLPVPVAQAFQDDVALHALGAGQITILIAGMLQLVAPVFAMERMGRPRRAMLSGVVFALLMTAASARVAGAIAVSAAPGWFDPLAAVSGVTGWLGLGLLLGTLLRAQIRGSAAGHQTRVPVTG